jgi:Zn-dependent protease with chaperone function
MRLTFFFVLALVFFAPLTHPQPVDAIRSIVLTSFVLLLMGLTAELPSTYLVHRIWREPQARFEVARLFRRLRRLHLFCAVGMYLSTLIFCGWPTVVRVNWHLDQTVACAEVLILFPFVLGLISSWSSFYRVERALHQTSEWAALEPFPSVSAFVTQQARYHLALLLEPLLVFIAIQGGWHGYAAGWHWAWLVLCGLGCILVITAVLPWLWSKLWSTAPIPSGPQREHLVDTGQRIGVTCTNYLLWNSEGRQALALIIGYLPWARYLVFSDLLLEQLSDEELEAIQAHELAHVRKHHLSTLLLYTLVSLLFWSWLGTLVIKHATDLTIWTQIGLQLPLILTIILYVRLTLGWLSRLLEREADLMGCLAWHDQSPQLGLSVFAGALYRVAQLNGESPDRTSWLHGSVSERTRALELLLDDPFAFRQFRRRMILLKTALLAGVITLGLWTIWLWQWT